MNRNVIALAGWLALCLAASGTAFFVSTAGWYAGLARPTWNPPSWVFAPVWTTLYIMMAAAAWLVWREGGWNVQGRPLGLFLLQWALNALWTPIFFAMHRAGLAFRRNRRALADACRDADIILASQGGGRCSTFALSGLGKFCGSAQPRHLAAESLMH
jgi:hypothetical protein